MKTVNTKDLEGAALDWAVALAVCPDSFRTDRLDSNGLPPWSTGWLRNGTPSENWSMVGPLIERYNIHLECGPLDKVGAQVSWEATVMDFETMNCDSAEGDTPLVAVCRAVVCGLIGDTVDVPESLL